MSTINRRVAIDTQNPRQPWRVTLLVRPSLLAVDLKPVVYFVRGRVEEVGNKAYLLWKRWEKDDLKIQDAYPDVEEAGVIECIDEADYLYAYREIKKHKLPHAVAGYPNDPAAFTCFTQQNIL